MLPQLEAVLRASPKVSAFEIIDNDPVDEANYLFKIRCELTPHTSLQIRLHAVAGDVRYSYQEIIDKPLRRWDNAPHFPGLQTFPHHHHDRQGNVTESPLTGDPIADLVQVLNAV